MSCNQQLESSANYNAIELLRSCIFGVWHTNEVEALFDYILATQSTDRPLRLSGFDSQFSSAFDTEVLKPYFNQVNEAKLFSGTHDVERVFDFYLSYIAKGDGCYDSVADDCQFLRDNVEWLRAELSLLADSITMSSAEAMLAKTILQSLIVNAESLSTFARSGGNYSAIRDQGMANNLIKLTQDYFVNQRIIVWAHNTHIAETFAALDGPWSTTKNMGSYLHEHFADELYTIGIYMLQGQCAGNDRSVINVKSTNSNSLESLVATAQKDIVFIPFAKQNLPEADDDWLHQPTENLYWGYKTQETYLAKAYDSVIVIKQSSIPEYLN